MCARVCVNACARMDTYACVHVCVCARIYPCAHAREHMHVYTRIHVCMCVCACACTSMHFLCTQTCLYARVCLRARVLPAAPLHLHVPVSPRARAVGPRVRAHTCRRVCVSGGCLYTGSSVCMLAWGCVRRRAWLAPAALPLPCVCARVWSVCRGCARSRRAGWGCAWVVPARGVGVRVCLGGHGQRVGGCARVGACTHACACACVWVQMCACKRVPACMCTCVCNLVHARVCVHVSEHGCAFMGVHILVWGCKYVHACA